MCTVHDGCSPSNNRKRSSGIPGSPLVRFPCWLPNISCAQWARKKCPPKDRLPKRTSQKFDQMFLWKLQVGLPKRDTKKGYQWYTWINENMNLMFIQQHLGTTIAEFTPRDSPNQGASPPKRKLMAWESDEDISWRNPCLQWRSKPSRHDLCMSAFWSIYVEQIWIFKSLDRNLDWLDRRGWIYIGWIGTV